MQPALTVHDEHRMGIGLTLSDDILTNAEGLDFEGLNKLMSAELRLTLVRPNVRSKKFVNLCVESCALKQRPTFDDLVLV